MIIKAIIFEHFFRESDIKQKEGRFELIDVHKAMYQDLFSYQYVVFDSIDSLSNHHLLLL